MTAPSTDALIAAIHKMRPGDAFSTGQIQFIGPGLCEHFHFSKNYRADKEGACIFEVGGEQRVWTLAEFEAMLRGGDSWYALLDGVDYDNFPCKSGPVAQVA